MLELLLSKTEYMLMNEKEARADDLRSTIQTNGLSTREVKKCRQNGVGVDECQE